jgi:glyoxylase-like metal-dependent hydrolase (beta-lactamase superfamily II)
VEKDLYRLNMGINSSFLLKYPEGYLLIDTSFPNDYGKIKDKLSRIPVEISEINYILLTHYHHDHSGSAAMLQEDTNARIIAHENAIPWLAKGDGTIFASWVNLRINIIFAINEFLSKSVKDTSFPPLQMGDDDIIISGDDDETLRSIGIPGKILYTPGHSQDSISVVLDDGRAFIGDIAVDFPKFLGTYYRAALIEDAKQMLESWEKIINAGALTLYPAHGPSFEVSGLVSALKKFK